MDLSDCAFAMHYVASYIWYTFDGEMVKEVHHYLDVLPLLQQLGALPG